MDNTRRFDLYVSGILYARLQLGGQTPLLQKLDVYSGAFSPWGPLTPEDRDLYKSFVKLDLGRIAEALPAYLERYNWDRPHSACGGRPPMSRIVGVNNLLAHNS